MRSTIIYDGEDLSSAPFGAELIESNVPGVPTPRVDVLEVPYGIGVSQGKYYKPLILTARCTVEGTSTADVRAKLDRIAGVMDVDSDRTLIFEQLGYEDRQWLARRAKPGKPKWINAAACEVTWQFVAADPIAESTTLTTESYNPANDAWTFYIPDTAGTVVGGNSMAYPTYTLTSTGVNTQPLKLKNVTRDDEELWYASNLPNTQLLRITSKLYTIEKSLDGGVTWSSVIGSTNTVSRFPFLDYGVRNEFLLTGCDDTTLVVTYRTRHLGG